MLSGDRPKHLLALVSFAGILTLISFALWPVFLTKLGQEWGLTNTDIGWISGAYFFGYLIATPVLVGLTDRVDARLVFLGGCAFSSIGCLLFATGAVDFWSAAISWYARLHSTECARRARRAPMRRHTSRRRWCLIAGKILESDSPSSTFPRSRPSAANSWCVRPRARPHVRGGKGDAAARVTGAP